jgi:DNA repair protein RadA/Sms
MAKARIGFACASCGARSAQWAGRCGTCGAWGSLQADAPSARTAGPTLDLAPLGDPGTPDDARVLTGIEGFDRVLGGGLVEGSAVLLAGEPGIGKSTLLVHVLGALAARGHRCLLASGEESRGQVAARARRLQVDTASIDFVPGRELQPVLRTASQEAPRVLAVDSIQTIRDPDAPHVPGGVAQVRSATDALVGLAKATGTAVLLTGHVTKDGDLAGPRALEHAVDVVLSFEGDARSGLRVLAAGKNRFGTEGESAWFEMGTAGLAAVDPSALLVSGARLAGAAVALPLRGRRGLAIEVQALVGSPEGSGRRQATGLDPRRFQLVAAVLERAASVPLGRAELFGATSGGVRIDDPACDLAVAAAVASAATGVAPPPGAAFVGEVALTGLVRPAAGMPQRLAAARAAGCRVVYAPPGEADALEGLRMVPVARVEQALTWCAAVGSRAPKSLPA